MSKLTWQGMLLRFLFAVVLVFSSYNPSEYSYYSWLKSSLPNYSVFMIFVGVVLLIGWVIYLRASLRSLGLIGLILAAAFFGVALWLIVDIGILAAENFDTITYLVLAAFAGVLGTGICWSHIRRRVSGQADVDDLQEE